MQNFAVPTHPIFLGMAPYGLRHFFISYCVMSGIPSLTIARWVGHSSSKMIELVYGLLTPDYRAEQMMKINIYKDGEQKSQPQANAEASQEDRATEGEVKDDRQE